ncbi:hypothetical protein LguiA_036030 [Lonicera macranthoides]
MNTNATIVQTELPKSEFQQSPLSPGCVSYGIPSWQQSKRIRPPLSNSRRRPSFGTNMRGDSPLPSPKIKELSLLIEKELQQLLFLQ